MAGDGVHGHNRRRRQCCRIQSVVFKVFYQHFYRQNSRNVKVSSKKQNMWFKWPEVSNLAYKVCACVCVYLHLGLVQRGFCPFHAGIRPRHLCRLYCMYVNVALCVGPLWARVCLHVRFLPGWLCVCVFVYAYVYIRVFVFAEQPCFMLLPVELRKFLCFLSGCWLLSRCCSSCCGTLSSIGNFSSLFHCFPSQGRRDIVLRGFLSNGATFAMQRLY